MDVSLEVSDQSPRLDLLVLLLTGKVEPQSGVPTTFLLLGPH